MVGRDSSPIVTTVAPTIPVLAPNSIPTKANEIHKPPHLEPNSSPIVSSSSSDILDFSIPFKFTAAQDDDPEKDDWRYELAGEMSDGCIHFGLLIEVYLQDSSLIFIHNSNPFNFGNIKS